MGGVSLGEVQPHDGYSCPWCPTVVLVVDSEAAARSYMEHHLDGHFSIGLPLAVVA
jgi:hypothetical protein